MKLDKKVMRLLNRFEHAAIGKSWMGGSDPANHEEILREYDSARNALLKYLGERLVTPEQEAAFETLIGFSEEET